jgi:glycine betaine transporter
VIVDGANAVAADMIVMSTHGFAGPARAVLGSTADEVVRTAHRPVLLVRQR